jgi:hypothetical protein
LVGKGLSASTPLSGSLLSWPCCLVFRIHFVYDAIEDGDIQQEHIETDAKPVPISYQSLIMGMMMNKLIDKDARC